MNIMWHIHANLQIIAIDMDRETYEIGLPVIKKAGVEHKIDFRESKALPILDQLLQDVSNDHHLQIKLTNIFRVYICV